MKKLSLLVILVVMGVTGVFAQILEPVKWQFAAQKINDKEAVIYMRAKIDKGWHIYSMNVADGGPIKTSFAFTPSSEFSLVGKTTEPKPKTKYEDVFGMDVSYFNDEVVFSQKIRLNKGQTTVRGVVEFMACDAEQCLPPDEYAFAVPIK